MRDLTQDEFQIKSAIANMLQNYTGDFRSRVTASQISRMADRLTIWGFSCLQIEETLEEIVNVEDSQFPTTTQIKKVLNRKKTAVGEVRKPDEQASKDQAQYEENYKDLKRILGEETLTRYIDFWHKENMKDVDDIYAQILGQKCFARIALADLVLANGNPKRAIQKIREQNLRVKEQAEKDNSTRFETKDYIYTRGKSVKECSFKIKERA